jgi:hypothetical protein
MAFSLPSRRKQASRLRRRGTHRQSQFRADALAFGLPQRLAGAGPAAVESETTQIGITPEWSWGDVDADRLLVFAGPGLMAPRNLLMIAVLQRIGRGSRPGAYISAGASLPHPKSCK